MRRVGRAYSVNGFVAFIWWAMLLFFISSTLQWKKNGCDGCLESERMALLQINSFFNNPFRLRNWGNGRLMTGSDDDDCCNWNGVSCDGPISGRVTDLELSYLYVYFTMDPKQLLVNASLFLPFQELRYLSIAGNGLVGCMENEGFEKLSALANLNTMDLRHNMFDNDVMTSLTTLSSLRHLYVSDNAIKGTIDMNSIGFGALINLEGLRLMYNNIHVLKGLEILGNLTYLSISMNNLVEVQGVSNLTKLQSIDLDNFSMSADTTNLFQNVTTLFALKDLGFSRSRLSSQGWPSLVNLETLIIYDSIVDDNFLDTIGIMMMNLTVLRVWNSPLDSTFPQGFCNLKRLEELNLPENNLRGELRQCLSNLTLLREIDLFNNQLEGDISKSPLTTLLSLERINISNNRFRVPLSLAPFFNHSRLEEFRGSSNKEIYRDDDHYEMREHGIPLFQLRYLELSSMNGDGGYVGSFPKFLYYQTNLESVDISNVKMKGDVGFPWWLLANNTNLHSLYLQNCSLWGSLQVPIKFLHLQMRLSILVISDNEFFGSIPTHLCAVFPNIQNIYFDSNKLSGEIPEQLSNCSTLRRLFASDNMLSGKIPTGIWNMPQLAMVDLSRNSFSGNLPPRFIPPHLLVLQLSRNELGGTLSEGEDHHRISSVKKEYANFQLQVLDLGHNHFTGIFPGWIAELPQVTHLLLNNNEFYGEVLTPMCLRRLKLIDVSHNRLSGGLSYALTSNLMNCNASLRDGSKLIETLEFVTKTNMYTYKGKPLLLMSGLDFSSNNFTGEIPPQISHLDKIKVLNFSYNMLTGPIPPTFSDLTAIESLDLSHNNWSGVIPRQLTQLDSLSYFNVAYNNLSGRCPQNIGQFITFNEDSYQGNPLLDNCTSPHPTPKSTEDGNNDDDDDDNDDKGDYIDMESFYGSSGVSFIMALLILASVLYINPNWRRVWFYYVGITVTTCYYFVVDHLPFPIRYKVLELRV